MTGPQTIQQLHEMASRPCAGVVEALRNIDGDFLVLGAGGKMGFHASAMLRRALDATGSTARVIAVSRFRSPDSLVWFQRYGIETCQADLLRDQELRDLPAARNILFLAGVKFGTGENPQLLHETNVELPAKVAKRFADSNVVALSTGCVYPFVSIDGKGSRESDPPQPPGQYAESCWQRELAIAAAPCPAVLVRLNYSVDLRYGVLVDIAQRIWHRQPVDLTTGAVNFIWQGDANAYILQAFSRVSRPPLILNVTGSEICRVRDLAEYFGNAFEMPVSFTGSPKPTAWLSNAGRCHQMFGKPSVSEQQLMQWVADWIRNGGEVLGKPTRFETRDGNF